MRMSLAVVHVVLVVVIGACSGDTPAVDRTCDGTLYDACSDEHECMSSNCHNFTTQQFQVCSTGCTVGDDTPCLMTSDGKKATCVATGTGTGGICTPPAANPCKR